MVPLSITKLQQQLVGEIDPDKPLWFQITINGKHVDIVRLFALPINRMSYLSVYIKFINTASTGTHNSTQAFARDQKSAAEGRIALQQ